METSAAEAPRHLELVTDAVVVGTGAGGAVMAAKLAERGLSVVMVEEGEHHKTESFNATPTESFRRLYRDAAMSAILGLPNIGFAEGRCVGGSTVVNGGMSWPTPDRVLRRWVEAGLPEIDSDSMAPWFAEVESRISVGQQSPMSIGKDSHAFRRGAEKLGYDYVSNQRNQHECLGSNNCMFGCPNKAKRSTLVTYVPDAMKAGADLVTGARVERVLMSGTRCVGVAGRFVNAKARPTGKTFVIRAKVVVLSCGAAQTPAMLMRSGFRGAHLGHHLWVHPNAKAIGLFDESLQSWKGVHQAFQVREFEDEGLLLACANVPPGIVALGMESFGGKLAKLMARYDNMMIGGILVEDSHAGRVRIDRAGQPVMSYFMSPQDMALTVRGVAHLCDVYLAAGAKSVILPFHGMPEIRSSADVQKLRRTRVPLTKAEIITVHIMGTCRMARDPLQGVTDPFGRVHGTDNLYVADASLFPGPIGVNPMETIMALSLRNAEAVSRSAEQSPSSLGSRGPEKRPWTFDSLRAASTSELEGALRQGVAPNIPGLAGDHFRGFNPPLFAQILGIRKFIKGFSSELEHDGAIMGYNVPVRQNAPDQPWRAKPSDERPKRFGYYRLAPVDAAGREGLYPNAVILDYGQGKNPIYEPAKVIRDYLVQVDPDNPDLLLGKAYLAFGSVRVHSNFFILERLGPAPRLKS